MSTLQELLNVGLVDIGGDDSRFEKIQAASAALASRLSEDSTLLIPATLVALDHDVDEADPVFDAAEEFVLAEWRTMRNTHVNRPRELLRSVLLDALRTLIEGNPEAAGAVWCTASGPVRHGQTRLGKEAAVVKRIIDEAWETAEIEAVRRAGLLPPVKRTRRKKLKAKAQFVGISSEVSDHELVQDVARAAGPNYSGHSPTDPNTQWPNAGQPWSQQFTPRMAVALAKAVNLGLKRLTTSLEDALKAHLAELDKQVADHLTKAVAEVSAVAASTEASRLRLEVLWWSEALYSPTLGRSYRELPLNVAAVAAAADLAAIVPPLAPTSVTYVLGEAMHRMASIGGGERAALGTYFSELGEYESLRERLPVVNRGGRCPLLDLLCEGVAGDPAAKEGILGRTGLDSELEIETSDFAMWVFRDLQARRLVEELP